MQESLHQVLRNKLSAEHLQRLAHLANPALDQFIAHAVELCEPDSVFICTDSCEDIATIRRGAVENREEIPLAIDGHTAHFDGPQDLGRDRSTTKYLVPASETLSKSLNQMEREAGLAEVKGLLKGSMKGRTMIVRFLSLGPANSEFSISCVQCTDSFYVAHSEDLLYRPGYQQFTRLQRKDDFFKFIHSSGRVDDRMISVEADKRRIYMDYAVNEIYSVNTQYAGNTVGLKKLALRLTIRKADREGWLAEHMFVMGVLGPNNRKTYLAGAFPSACGKTSTAMLPGETILGDDIAYFRVINSELRAVNAELGIFGIIQDINASSDPTIHKVLTTPGEVIFSNVLLNDRKPYWYGMGRELPSEGTNSYGAWKKGMLDEQGQPAPPAAKNARYTVCISALRNVDCELENPVGVPLRGIMYGGRDYSTSVPVRQSFDWEHGIITCGAFLETVTTFATVEEEGKPEINAMSIQDFVSIPLGKYIENNLAFGRKLKNPPLIFGVNYFLHEKDHYLTGIRDKAVWAKWMELRVHGEVDAIETPMGYIPKYEDLRPLFMQVLGAEYTREQYDVQFRLRVPQNLAKLDRMEEYYRTKVVGTPAILFDVLDKQRERLKQIG